MDNFKVLIVDDDTTTCSLLETILDMEGYQTVSVNELGADGLLTILTEEQPQLLILDYHLGTEETIDSLKAIRANEQWQQLLVLMTSAINRQRECFQAGTDDFLQKPFQWQQLTKTVQKLITNKYQ